MSFSRQPAFATPLATGRRTGALPLRHACTAINPRRPSVVPCIVPARSRRAARVTMLGPFFPNLENSKMLKSEVVRNEMAALERDYMEIAKLGARYETFDRQGKMMFIDRALDVVDRWDIFLNRIKLSEDFESKMFINQYRIRLEQVGLTIESLLENTKKSLQMMKDEIPKA